MLVCKKKCYQPKCVLGTQKNHLNETDMLLVVHYLSFTFTVGYRACLLENSWDIFSLCHLRPHSNAKTLKKNARSVCVMELKAPPAHRFDDWVWIKMLIEYKTIFFGYSKVTKFECVFVVSIRKITSLESLFMQTYQTVTYSRYSSVCLSFVWLHFI